MNEYKGFSYYFDQIMEYIDYHDWLSFTKQYVKQDKRILDLACGSGTLAVLLSVEGFKVDGLDLSAEMIGLANDKFKAYHILNTLYTCDMSSFSLPRKYDAVTCYFDSVNHLPTIEHVKQMMNCVYEALNENGLFLFDVFSKSKYDEMDNTDISEDFDDFSYNWKIKLKKPNILTHDITIKADSFIHEIYNEYYYDLNDFIDKSKFEIIKICGDFNDDLEPEDERILVVLKKKC
ncbi:MAG: class I SAM-dependent methyltransferase [Acholeplasmatales bacterium]|nr:class I SAM-dependent methyltransferase [Acholeplasmatales bacterium]